MNLDMKRLPNGKIIGQVRQGDVLVHKVIEKKIPKGAEQIQADNQRTILAYGEVTGHAHALDATKTALYEWQGNRLLERKTATPLKHEEHRLIQQSKGLFKVIQQKECTPEAIRNVAD